MFKLISGWNHPLTTYLCSMDPFWMHSIYRLAKKRNTPKGIVTLHDNFSHLVGTTWNAMLQMLQKIERLDMGFMGERCPTMAQGAFPREEAKWRAACRPGAPFLCENLINENSICRLFLLRSNSPLRICKITETTYQEIYIYLGTRKQETNLCSQNVWIQFYSDF